MKGFYVTTAIDYVNGSPHLGHAYEKFGADVLARYKKLRNEEVLLLVGTDEHSQNVALSASAKGLPTKEYCDEMAVEFAKLYDLLDIDYDKFVRTTNQEHELYVQRVVNKLEQEGYIYQGKYQGWYCSSCEAFLDEEQLVNGKCPVHGSKSAEWVSEVNYFFALSQFQGRLLEHIKNNPLFIQPQSRRNEVLNRIKEGLRDVSISRASATWGIPLPFEQDQVIYVWIDALISYLSGISDEQQRWWPADYHIIGKDILWFHSVIWPSLLMALKLPLPKSIFAHGFINDENGEKLSKSAGIVIDPQALTEQYGAEILRYYLIKEIQWGRDGNFSTKELERTYNTDLANDYGNLLSRTLAMVEKYFEGQVPATATNSIANLQQEGAKAVTSYLANMDMLNFSAAIGELWGLIDKANKYIDLTRPWLLAKDHSKREQLQTVLYNLLEVLRIVTIACVPILPKSVEKCWQQLGLPGLASEQSIDNLNWGGFPIGIKVHRGEPVFPRII